MTLGDTNLRGRVVVVTGAAGFIGSHLVEALVRNGCRVRAFVRYNSRGSTGWLDDVPAQIRKEIEVIAADIRDGPSVTRSVRGSDFVFHLAALIGIPYSYVAPEAYVATNVTGTLNVLDAVRLHDVSRVVITSTSEVYGSARRVPIDEAHPIHPQSPYAASKAAADLLALSYHAAFNTPVVVVRPFNTYGPRQSHRAVIPTIAAQLLAGGPVRLGATHPTRDFIYVLDTVEGFLRAAATPEIEGRTIHLGSGTEISISDLACLVARVIERPLTVVKDEQRMRPVNSEVERLISDPSLARSLLGWKAEIDLREGVARTVDWIRRRQTGPTEYAV